MGFEWARGVSRPRIAGLCVLVLAAVWAPPRGIARALVWPDVAERIEHDLAAADPAVRRAAARDLRTLSAERGAPLALGALDDPDDGVRLAAAESAIRLHVTGATDKVAAWLNAPDPRLRREACEVARALPSLRALAPLARTLGDPDAEVRSAAAEALGHQASEEAVPPLLGRLDDPTPAVRVQIVGALARLRDARAVVPLVGKIEDSAPEVREAVARALSALGDTRASSALLLALRDQNAEVRREALSALGRLRAADAVDAIAPFIADRTPALRLTVMEALGRIATPEAIKMLVGALGTGDDAQGSLDRTPVRDALVAAGPQAVPFLHAALAGSPSPPVATAAAWVLGELHATAQAPAIVAAMRRGALSVAAALHALAGAGTEAEVPVVLEFVTDPSPTVRDEALRAAMALLDPNRPDGRAVEPLAAALRDPRPSASERARLAALLGRTGAPRAAPLLVALTHSSDPSLRLAAIDALGSLGPTISSQAVDADVDDALLDALRSADPPVRLRAAIALSRRGGARARDAMVRELDEGTEVDRAAVLTALGGILNRVPTDASVRELAGAMTVAAGPEYDAIVEAIARAPLPAATGVLAVVARSSDAADRREAAKMCGARPADPQALAIARALLRDSDASVVADAAWSLGAIGDPFDLTGLDGVASGENADAAVDAVAAEARIVARANLADGASRWLCPKIADATPYKRANALAGLAMAGARCGDGAVERAELLDDAHEEVRSAAAMAVQRSARAMDQRALERCANADPSSAVASRCARRVERSSRTHAALVYAVPEGVETPRPSAAYAMLFANGTIRAGTTDRRGAVFEPAAPEGDVTLRRPAALTR